LAVTFYTRTLWINIKFVERS